MFKISSHVIKLTALVLIFGYSMIPAYSQMQSDDCKKKCHEQNLNRDYENCKRDNQCEYNQECKNKCKELPAVLEQNAPYDQCKEERKCK